MILPKTEVSGFRMSLYKNRIVITGGTGRFAQSFAPVLGNIGARAGEFGKIKRTQQEKNRKCVNKLRKYC